MSNVKWIKIITNMFEDEKIDFIESLPESDSIIIIWIKLLTIAGKCNSGGFIYLTEKIPYTENMLSHKFKRPLATVRLALKTLTELEMIEFDEESFLKITNWEKHQNIDGLAKIREQNRKRVANYRERQKQLPRGNVTSNVTVADCNPRDRELELELDKETDIYKGIIEYLNSKANKNYKYTSKSTQRLIDTRIKEGFVLDELSKYQGPTIFWRCRSGEDPSFHSYS